MKGDSTERTICLKDMLFAALSQWKKWLLAAVILGLLLGGYKGVTTWMVATDATVHAEQVQEYEDALASYQNTKSVLEHTIEKGTQVMKDQESYLKKSVLMRLDYRNVYEASIALYVFTDYRIQPGMMYQNPDPTPVVVAAYQTALMNHDLLDDIAQQVDMEPRFLRELITVTQPEDVTGTLNVTVQNESEEKTRKVVDLLVGSLEEVQKSVAQSAGAHTLKTAVGTVGATVDTALAKRQDTESELFTQYKENLLKAQQELEELVEPVDATETKKSAVMALVKWGVVGGVAGALLVFLILCIGFAASDRVYSAETLEQNTDLRCLGALADGNPGYGRLTRWIRRKEGRPEADVPGAEELIAARVQQYCAGGTSWLVSGEVDAEALQAQTARLQKALPEMRFVCGSLLQDPAAARGLVACDGVLLVEKCGQSTYAGVRREMTLAQDAGKRIAGFIALDS